MTGRGLHCLHSHDNLPRDLNPTVTCLRHSRFRCFTRSNSDDVSFLFISGVLPSNSNSTWPMQHLRSRSRSAPSKRAISARSPNHRRLMPTPTPVSPLLTMKKAAESSDGRRMQLFPHHRPQTCDEQNLPRNQSPPPLYLLPPPTTPPNIPTGTMMS